MGFVFVALSLPYFVGALLFPKMCKKVSAKIQFLISFGLSALAMAFMGPIEPLGIDHHLWMVITGLTLLGLQESLVFIPCLPEAITSYQTYHQIIEGEHPAQDNRLNDIISSFYLFTSNLSALVGPIIGGILYDYFEYQITMNIILWFNVTIGILFSIFNRE